MHCLYVEVKKAYSGPEGSRMLRFPDFKIIGKIVSPKHWPHLPSRKYPWKSFLLEAASKPEP